MTVSSTGFAGKVAFVTGAGSGIGRTTAVAFARAGARVALADLSPDGLRKTARLIEEAGGQALALSCDVTSEDDVRSALDDTVQAFGRLDVAFNNAGVEQPVKSAADITKDEWDRVIGVSLTRTFLCMKHQIPCGSGESSPAPTRRIFIATSTAVGGAVLAGSVVGGTSLIGAEEATAAERPPSSRVSLTINGTRRTVTVDNRTSLLDLLREHLGLTGSKKDCNAGACGACTVLVDGHRVNACLTLTARLEGAEITTIEGLADDGERRRAVGSAGKTVAQPEGDRAQRRLRNPRRLQQGPPSGDRTGRRGPRVAAVRGGGRRCSGTQRMRSAGSLAPGPAAGLTGAAAA